MIVVAGFKESFLVCLFSILGERIIIGEEKWTDVCMYIICIPHWQYVSRA